MDEAMKEEIQFRKMGLWDIPAVAEIEKQLFSQPWSEQSFAESLNQGALFIVALDRNTIVGYCGMYSSFDEGEITNVAVTPSRHNQGIGCRMLKCLLGQAHQAGISHIILEARISNGSAIHLYEKLGFKNCGIRKNLYEMPREDGMVMALEW